MGQEQITLQPTADTYGDALTIGPSFYATKALIRVDTQNAALMQLAVGEVDKWSWLENREYVCPAAIIVNNVIGARFRSAVAGAPATVSAYLLTPADPDFELAVPLGSGGGGGSGGGVTGDIVYSGATSRADAVLCDGSLYDGTQATYLALWNAIGVTFGGSGQSSFAVPDLRDRVPVGDGGNTTLGQNEGLAAGSRVHTRHRHTTTADVITATGSAAGSGGFNAPSNWGAGRVGVNTTDPLDGPAFLGLRAFILL